MLHASEEAAESLLFLFSPHQSVGQQLSWEMTRDLKAQLAGKRRITSALRLGSEESARWLPLLNAASVYLKAMSHFLSCRGLALVSLLKTPVLGVLRRSVAQTALFLSVSEAVASSNVSGPSLCPP